MERDAWGGGQGQTDTMGPVDIQICRKSKDKHRDMREHGNKHTDMGVWLQEFVQHGPEVSSKASVLMY